MLGVKIEKRILIQYIDNRVNNDNESINPLSYVRIAEFLS